MALRSNDRVFVLELMDSKKDAGLVDPQVFTGKNALHAVMDERCMWRFKYERGVVPPPLREIFTSFKLAYEHAELYLKSRNVKIVEVKD